MSLQVRYLPHSSAREPHGSSSAQAPTHGHLLGALTDVRQKDRIRKVSALPVPREFALVPIRLPKTL